jgi:hypothetical protein
VGELWPGQQYRVPVRLVVPVDQKATGFHLTGGHTRAAFERDAQVKGVGAELIRGGVGLVHTVVQEPRTWGQADLGNALQDRFLRTLDPQLSLQYWVWPATLMRATTAAYAQTNQFRPGKVAVSGGSKNGASPSVAIIHDSRITALHASVSPPWDSPLRLCDRQAWDALKRFNKAQGDTGDHPFLGGTFGPVYNPRALQAGHSWDDLQALASRVAPDLFIALNLKALQARRVDLLFHPGTHDFVCYDLAWGGAHYPRIPLYLQANSGHGLKRGHPAARQPERNRDAFLLTHFFDGPERLLEPPSIRTQQEGRRLQVSVRFPEGSVAETGRIWWLYDRAPDGSWGYLRHLIPDDQWSEMQFDPTERTWTAEIELERGASTIDLFSSHRKTIRHESRPYPTYISSPYTRVQIAGPHH